MQDAFVRIHSLLWKKVVFLFFQSGNIKTFRTRCVNTDSPQTHAVARQYAFDAAARYLRCATAEAALARLQRRKQGQSAALR
jgi:hypothetical protein